MQTRTERYLARVHSHLPTLADDAARRDFIEGQLAKFEEDYATFMRKVGEGKDVGDVTAYDFSETIAALQIEMSKVSEYRAILDDLNAGAAEMAGRVASLEKALLQ